MDWTPMDWTGARRRIVAVMMAVLCLLVLHIAYKAYTTRDRLIDVAIAVVCAAVGIRAWLRRNATTPVVEASKDGD
jgi:putative effector of murein hydrolase